MDNCFNLGNRLLCHTHTHSDTPTLTSQHSPPADTHTEPVNYGVLPLTFFSTSGTDMHSLWNYTTNRQKHMYCAHLCMVQHTDTCFGGSFLLA
jgi:hypothetical protein